MKLRNFKISNQLMFTQVIGMVLVLNMGIISYFGANLLWKNAESFHNHPFVVQAALASIEVDVLNARLIMEKIEQDTGKDAIQSVKMESKSPLKIVRLRFSRKMEQ